MVEPRVIESLLGGSGGLEGQHQHRISAFIHGYPEHYIHVMWRMNAIARADFEIPCLPYYLYLLGC